uniref:Myb-like domain-containing protein n=1 Tax=Cannabis sativa TaxID=3483 RepID=A0A803NWS9_CANSA
MEDQYGGIPAEFRQLMAVRTELQQPQPLISPAHHLGEAPYTVHSSNYQQQYSYGQTSSLCGVGLVEHQFGSGQHINMSGSNGVALYHDLESSSGTGGLWMSSSNTNNNMGNYDNNTMNTTRWPRQETLTLLEIRSRLNPRFKDTNQKGPLWDQISRIMAEEHGYQRSGKKCKEKFENLYKYYKKTKEGKARKQDGKHYRFFRQLEAIYGHDQNSNIDQSPLLVDQTHHIIRPNSLLYQYPNKISDHNSLNSFSINNSSDQFETSSSDNNMNNKDEDQKMKGVGEIRGKKKSSWKAKVEEFVDSQMKKIMAARVDEKINEFWAKEKAWIEARDAAVMGAFNKLTDALMKQDDQRDHGIITGLRLMDDTTNTSNVAAATSHMNNPTNCFNLLFGEEENLWEKYGSLKLGNKDRLNQL